MLILLFYIQNKKTRLSVYIKRKMVVHLVDKMVSSMIKVLPETVVLTVTMLYGLLF